MLHAFPESAADRELRELFNVCWHPAGVVEGLPAAPDVQSLPSGRYGNIFDVLVDRPTKADAIFRYPVVWAAGDVDLRGLAKTLEEYIRKGGTLVVTSDDAPKAEKRVLPDALLGFAGSNTFDRFEGWHPAGGPVRATTPSTTRPPMTSPKSGPSDVRPLVGFSPTRPHSLAGMRIDPPPSFACPMGTMPEATAAADPPLEPPVECPAFHGLLVAPYASGSVVGRIPSSGVFVFPTNTKPAARNFAAR